MATFNALDRTAHLEELANTHWDLLIIGGGITGAGILLDAVSRGMKAALVEKHDFAWGTSSRSTKLIHGGLRYLKQFEFGLVREVGLERTIVYNNARHLVRSERMLLPIIEGGSLGKITSSVGLWVYDFLADVEKEEKRRMLSREETLQAEPLLKTEGLLGGSLYYEYRTDDARLTTEILKKAAELGGLAINYSELVAFNEGENGRLQSVKIHDRMNASDILVTSEVTINACGPWVDQVRNLDRDKVSEKQLHLTKGVHLVVPFSRLPLVQSVYFDVADGRMIFCIPRDNKTYIGTTDTNYSEVIDAPRTSENDVLYLLNAANAMFPTTNLTLTDVESTWAGLRPLIHEEGKDPSELSRKDEIFISSSGLISIAGGKLTGYRKMAERTVDEAIRLNGTFQKYDSTKTASLKLSGAEFYSDAHFSSSLGNFLGSAQAMGFAENLTQPLFEKYGTNAIKIVERAAHITHDRSEPLLRAEIEYCCNHEMTQTLSDFFIRRTGSLYFNRQEIPKILDLAAKVMSEILGWSDEISAKMLADFKKEYEAVLDFN